MNKWQLTEMAFVKYLVESRPQMLALFFPT